jgi:O-antigen ligase
VKVFAQRWLPWTFGLWVVGVQAQEVLATTGAYATLALAAVLAWPFSGWRRYSPLLAFIGWCALAPLLGGRPPTGTGLARLADFLLIPAAAVATSRLQPKALERVGLAAAVTLAVSLVAAAAQHLGLWPGREAFESLGWTRQGFTHVYEPVPGRTDRFMAGGLLLHRLKFANVTAVMAVLGAAAVVARVRRWPLYLAMTVAGLLGIWIFPHARAASVAALLAVGLVWVAGERRRGRALLGAMALAAVAVAVALAVPSVRARFETSLTAEGSGERSALTQAGLNAVATSPLVGVGLGRFRPGLYLPADAPAQAREHPGKAHDQLVTVAAEAGLPAALLLVAVLLLWLRAALRTLPAGALLAGGVALFGLLSALHDPLFHVESSLALMLLLGVGLGRAGLPDVAARS